MVALWRHWRKAASRPPTLESAHTQWSSGIEPGNIAYRLASDMRRREVGILHPTGGTPRFRYYTY